MSCRRYTIQVQAQFEIEAANEEDACDEAVRRAAVMDEALWATVTIDNGPCKPSRKKKP